jgi:cytochrome c556
MARSVNSVEKPSSFHRRQRVAFLLAMLISLALPLAAQQPDSSMANMPGMNTGSANDMKDMGPSMAAMAGHMYITPLRPVQPGDEEKVKAIVAQVRASIERYQDYKKAQADGYVIANPDVDEPQFHFNNPANIAEAAKRFDPAKPSSLLYFKNRKLKYKLEGVMFTVPPNASEDELNSRIPLSVVRWHKHINFCAAPASRVQEYLGQHPKFGMFGSINTAAACKADGGTFYPVMFTWMIHVFPFETNLKNVFSMNDDVPHFGTEK